MWIMIIYDVMHCSLVRSYKCFGGTYYLHLQDRTEDVSNSITTQNPHFHCCENLKPHMVYNICTSSPTTMEGYAQMVEY
jgi:hypothetical protein